MKRYGSLLTALLLTMLCLSAEAQVVLTGNFGKDAELVSQYAEDDGDYSEILLVDSGVLIVTGREEIEPGENDSLEAVLETVYPDADDVTELAMEPVAGYPARRVRVTQGGDEDASLVDYVYIATEDRIYYAEITVPADWWEDYAELVDIWVESIDLFDDGIEEALPGEDLPDEAPESQPYPPEWAEIEPYVELTESSTVEELAEMFGVSWYNWEEQDGGLRLLLTCEGGGLVVIPAETGPLKAEDGAEGAGELPGEALESPCGFVTARWDSAGFPLHPVRDLYVGDDMDRVVEAFAGGERIEAEGEEGCDETITYVIPADESDSDWAELTYFGSEGRIARIQLDCYEETEEAE